MPTAVITGASRGLGLALARALAQRSWQLVVDARGADALAAAAQELSRATSVVAVCGDVADAAHRKQLAAAAEQLDGLDLLVNNASVLGPSPQPALDSYPLDALARVYQVNTVAPLALAQLVLPQLRRRGGRVVNVSSDAAGVAYPGWGGYGSAKAALDQISAVLAVEHPELAVYAFDPGDMRTQLQQEAFPGEDVSDRPPPESVLPALLRLLDDSLPSGRYTVTQLEDVPGGSE